MNKNYLFPLLLSFVSLSLAQKNISDLSKSNKYAQFETVSIKNKPQSIKGVTIWSNDFSNNAEWIYDNTSSPYLNWCITTAADTIPVTALSPALFTTVNNGFAFIN
mgnify:FL=1